MKLPSNQTWKISLLSGDDYRGMHYSTVSKVIKGDR